MTQYELNSQLFDFERYELLTIITATLLLRCFLRTALANPF